MSYRLATDFYMQQTTYKHDYNPGGISPRNRQTDYPYGADAPKADVPGPLNNFRPRFGDPLPQHIRDLDGQRFDEAPLTDRQRVKRGEEWIGGRRYEEPRTDRGVYNPPRRRYYEMDGQRNISPNRRYDRMYRELDDGRHTSLDRPINKERMWESELERQNLRPGRHTSLDRYDTMDKRKENLKQYMRNRRQDPLEGGYPERGRNGSPERHLDRGREYERPRNESPSRWDRDRNTYNAVDDRRYDPSRDKYKYPDWYEKPLQPMMDSYANQQKMADRTTYRDYGEFLQDRIKREELRKQPLEYPAANLPKSTNSGVYLFMRTHMDGKPDVVKALKEGRSVLANSYGQLKGIANSTEIHLLEGRPEGWTHVPSSKPDRSWDVGDSVIIFWFPTRKEAEMWLYHEKKFQRASFPEYHGSDMACLPINWNPENDRHYPTFLVTEYEGIVDPDQFREKFVSNMYDILQRHKAERFVIQTVGIKMFRGNWFKQRSVVTCNRFPSSQAALDFYNDPDYERLRRSVREISKSRTTFMFTLTERPV
ncbi:uncharacterized protein LOC125664304 isoform X23 [Ostrea edulis]|uniref:uncharacterized protein LOC125664304 isoform X23 n=1 Tax=Ostrea edulis TaxID=37623 RepID=UPI0024AF469A|nr:uncharacterized protein LOC125664304 isoform X23 [Ostrea edulis]